MVQMLRRQAGAPLQSGPAKLATTATTRTRGSSWQATRARILRRDAGLCLYCQPFGHYTPATEVDHRRPLWAGGSDADRNLASTCSPHHRLKTAAEEHARQAGQLWQPWQPEPLPDR